MQILSIKNLGGGVYEADVMCVTCETTDTVRYTESPPEPCGCQAKAEAAIAAKNAAEAQAKAAAAAASGKKGK